MYFPVLSIVLIAFDDPKRGAGTRARWSIGDLAKFRGSELRSAPRRPAWRGCLGGGEWTRRWKSTWWIVPN